MLISGMMIRFRFSNSKYLSRDVIGMLWPFITEKRFHEFNTLKIVFSSIIRPVVRDNRSHLRLLHCRCRNYYICHYRLGSCHLGCHHSCCQNLANRQDQIDDDLDRANRCPDCRCKVGSAEDHPIVYLGKNKKNKKISTTTNNFEHRKISNKLEYKIFSRIY